MLRDSRTSSNEAIEWRAGNFHGVLPYHLLYLIFSGRKLGIKICLHENKNTMYSVCVETCDFHLFSEIAHQFHTGSIQRPNLSRSRLMN